MPRSVTIVTTHRHFGLFPALSAGEQGLQCEVGGFSCEDAKGWHHRKQIEQGTAVGISAHRAGSRPRWFRLYRRILDRSSAGKPSFRQRDRQV